MARMLFCLVLIMKKITLHFVLNLAVVCLTAWLMFIEFSMCHEVIVSPDPTTKDMFLPTILFGVIVLLYGILIKASDVFYMEVIDYLAQKRKNDERKIT